MSSPQPPEVNALQDLAWRGFDLRAAVPLTALAIILSTTLLAGRWYVDGLSDALITYFLVLALWPALLGHTIYRTITYTYRITDRALLVDRGSLHRHEAPVWFKELLRVETGAGWVDRMLGIGWVSVSTAGRTLHLRAIRDPHGFAAMLRERMKAMADP